jgi:predicted nucleotidyltransferase
MDYMMTTTIAKIKDIVSQIAPSYPIISVDLFGSYATNEATETSDVDLLVYFDRKTATLFDLIGLKQSIEDELNLKVDVVAGPLNKDSYLTIDKKIRIYEA